MGWRYKNNGYSAIMRSHVNEICKELNTSVSMGKREETINEIIRDMRNLIKEVEIPEFSKKKVVNLFGR